MTTRFAAAIAAGLMLTGTGPAIAQSAPTLAPEIRNRLAKVVDAAQHEDCKKAIRLARPLTTDARLPAELGAMIYELLVSCEVTTGSNDQALADAIHATESEAAPDSLWHLRLRVAIATNRLDAAVTTVEAMTQGRGAALNSVSLQWIWELAGKLKDGGDRALRKRLLAVLAGPSYTPDAVPFAADGFRSQYAAMLVEDGQTADARPVVAAIRGPSALAAAGYDPKLRGLLPAPPDIRAAAEAALAVNSEQMALYPDRLGPVTETASSLRLLGRPKEALDLMQSVAARIEDPEAFVDRDEYLNWWWNSLAATYRALGRYDDGVAAYRRGAAVDENGGGNVSQVINLAGYQHSFGHSEDALSTLEVIDREKRSLSPYGELQKRTVRSCANAALGRSSAAAEDLAYARAHAKDAPTALGNILICTGDMDAAAAALIAQIDDPDGRIAVLLELSDYDEPPVAVPRDPFTVKLEALKARPDVQAAIARAGGVRRFHVQGEDL